MNDRNVCGQKLMIIGTEIKDWSMCVWINMRGIIAMFVGQALAV